MERAGFLEQLASLMDMEDKHSSDVLKLLMDEYDWSFVDKDKTKEAKSVLKKIYKHTLGNKKMIFELFEKNKWVEGNEV